MSHTPNLLFEFPTADGQPRSMRFTNPVEIIVARTPAEVRPALRAVQRGVAAGLYAAGYIAYEAAPAFDPALVTHAPTHMPLLWFGLFRAPAEADQCATDSAFQLADWHPATTQPEYERNIAAIRAAIGRGETYQVNYTIRLRAAFAGDDRAFYRQLRAAQAANYCAYLDLGRYRILSASPELFFRWDGDRITTRPMKGTARRGRWSEEDQQLARWLAASEKDRAENLMIVDLLRNDIGRIAAIGSVEVPHLFEIERYRTVHQLTSTVSARVRSGITLEDVFAALFPCGSITGAPKVQTMQLISALEDTPRGIYCGAIGFVAPGGEAVFNVAIRTAVVDTQLGTAEYGVGGGITWDSRAGAEYAEALLKAALLRERWPAFDLLETLRLEHGDYALLGAHLARLAASAHYFGIPFVLEHIQALLEEHARAFFNQSRRVRLLVALDGVARVESQPLPAALDAPQLIAFAHTPISADDRFLFHKTTNRAVYETHRAAQPELFDVLLWNAEGQVTECTTGNFVIELDRQRWTPPIACGLLPGTMRAELLARGELQERIITRDDVERATRCWLINSVRGWVEVRVRREAMRREA